VSPSLLDVASVREYLGRRLIVSVDTDEKRLALTFDDGPHPSHTPKLLGLLAAKGVRATFFVVGRRVRRFRDVLAATAAAGHEIGNHGDHHVPLSILPPSLIRRELDVCGRLVEEIAGRRPRFMRPPMGWISDVVLANAREMGYEPVIGSIHPQDSRQPGLETILRRVRRRVEPGAVLILHDGGWRVGADRSQTIAAVDILTDELLAAGYRFETLSDLVQEGQPAHGGEDR